MTANPVDLIGGLATTGNVVKADISSWAKARVAQVLADATEVRNTVLAGQLVVYIKVLGANYTQDTTDTTTTDDGLTCIISSDGKRFKPQGLVAPTTVSLGGVFASAASPHQFVTGLDTTGNLLRVQPAFTDISGSVAASQMPALAGDVTTVAGAVATTIAANAVTNAKAAQMAANTIKGNNTAGAANAADLTGPQAATVIGCWGNNRLAKTAAYSAVNADKGQTIALGGSAFYALTFSAASGYDANFSVVVINEDTVRAKTIALNGFTNFLLYPGQTILIFAQNNVWRTIGRDRWKLAGNTLNVYADFANGLDTNDGLAAGAGNAKKTIQAALDQASNDFDFSSISSSVSIVFVNVLAGSTDTQGVHLAAHAFVGAAGRSAVVVDGGAGATISTTSTDAFGAFCNVQFELRNMTLKTTTSGDGLVVGDRAQCVLGAGMNFGACAGSHISATLGGKIIKNANYTVSGSAGNAHVFASNIGSQISSAGLTVTVTANITIGLAWAYASILCNIIDTGMTFSLGAFTVTGKRYQADVLALISTNTGSATYFPGTVAGTTSVSGVYQ